MEGLSESRPRNASAPFDLQASSRKGFHAEARSGGPREAKSRLGPRRRGAWWRDLSPGPKKTLTSWMERSRARRRRSRPRGRSPRVVPPRSPRAPRETAAQRCSSRTMQIPRLAPLARDDRRHAALGHRDLPISHRQPRRQAAERGCNEETAPGSSCLPRPFSS